MTSVGFSGELLPLMIGLEMGGGLALLLGFQTRLTAFALSVLCIVTGVLFHSGADPM